MKSLKGLRGKAIRILVRSTNWIGDAVMTTPAMAALRAFFPAARITVAANPSVAELFSPHPSCDEVIVLDKQRAHQGLQGLFRFSRILNRERFDLALLFQNALEAGILAWLARIPIRAGYSTDGRGFLLTHRVPVGRAERAMHHTAYYLHMLKSLGIEGGNGRLCLTCTASERAWAQSVLGEDFWVAINPGATYGSAKRWFPDRFARVASTLAGKTGAGILLVGGATERAIGAEIEKAVNGRVLNLMGETSVRQLMALLEKCRLLITNDSGPMHVAAALGIPLVALFGPTDHTTTSPLADNWRLVRKPAECAPCLKRTCPTDHRCMEAIGPDDVLQAVKDLMGLDLAT
ncbi:MAG: lipopolysaccharide heptosyltransferase II [Deltaproteobacteria bacterium]|nr:lipopolysaccharide heptosyltransferase II [Deltaproteobacteria bacterium]